MDNYSSLAQKDGKASSGGKTVTNYTVPLPTPPQPQMEGKTPFKSRTCNDTSTKKY